MPAEEDSIIKTKEEKKPLKEESKHTEKEDKNSKTKLSEESTKETIFVNTQRTEDSNSIPIIIPIKPIKTTKREIIKHEYITEIPSVKVESKKIKPIPIKPYPKHTIEIKKVEVIKEIPKVILTKSTREKIVIITPFNILKKIKKMNAITQQKPFKKVPIIDSFPISSILSKSATIDMKEFKSKALDLPKIETIIDKKEISLESRVVSGLATNGSGNDDNKIFEWLEFNGLPLHGLEGIRTSSNRPICLILPKYKNESYIHTLSLICRELYRIVKGGKPEPRWLSEGSKEEIEEYMKADNRIFIIDDTKYKLLPDFNTIKNTSDLLDRVKESKLLDRLHELFSQDYGFIISHIPSEWVDMFAELLKREAGYFIPTIIMLARKYMLDEVKRILASICWGFVEVNGNNFDELFGNAEKSYYNALEEVNMDVELKHNVNQDENAGFEHESLKLIIVKALAIEHGAKDKRDVIRLLKDGIIETEYNINDGRADIYVKQKNRFIEIETLYGTEDPITKKIDKVTLNKYKGMNANVDIILLGLHILLYARDLYKLKRLYKDEYNITVDFYTIDVKECRLVSIKELYSILKRYHSGI